MLDIVILTFSDTSLFPFVFNTFNLNILIKVNKIQIKYHLECASILKGHGIVGGYLQKLINTTKSVQMKDTCNWVLFSWVMYRFVIVIVIVLLGPIARGQN